MIEAVSLTDQGYPCLLWRTPPAVAAMVLTTEASFADLPEPPGSGPAPASDMGGMYYPHPQKQLFDRSSGSRLGLFCILRCGVV
jgi:hypothetical protein